LARRKELHAVDLDTYISKNSRFKSFVYNRRDIQTIADNLGFKADRVRAELRKLGYCLIETMMVELSGKEMRSANGSEAQNRYLTFLTFLEYMPIQ
jgi:hypothetical protein